MRLAKITIAKYRFEPRERLYIELWKNNTRYEGYRRIFDSYSRKTEEEFRRTKKSIVIEISERDFQLLGNRGFNHEDNWKWVKKNCPEVFL